MTELQKTYDFLDMLILQYLNEMKSKNMSKTRLNRLGIEIRRLMIMVEERYYELLRQRI